MSGMSVGVKADRLEELLKKERAHDDYLAATQRIRRLEKTVQRKAIQGQSPHTIAGDPVDVPPDPNHAYALGYSSAIRDMATSILEEAAARNEPG